MSLTVQTLTLYWRFIKKYPRYLWGAAIFAPFVSLLQTFIPAVVAADVLGKLSVGNYDSEHIWASFGWDIVIFSGSVFFGTVIAPRLMMVFVWGLERRVQQDMAHHIFSHLLLQSADFHADHFGGSLVSQTNKFLSAYKQLADATATQLIMFASALVFSSIILWPKAPLFVIIVVILSVGYAASVFYATRFIRQLHADTAAASSQQTGYLADSVTNILTIKSFAAEKLELTRFARATGRTFLRNTELMRAVIKRDIYFSNITSGIRIVALILAIASVALWHADIGTVLLLFTFTAVISNHLWSLSGVTARTINNAFGDARDMTEILLTPPSVKDPDAPQKTRIKKGDIDFNAITFGHASTKRQQELFTNFNLAIHAGERVGLVGHSGSGKTTLTKLLLRFADVQAGTITIDGQDITSLCQADVRAHIAYVPQEPLLFHRSIAENIAYGKPGATLSEISLAARKANAAEFIEKLPNGYDTLVGERGIKLSGGQRQRIAIARAILKDAPILVLDEATSALDSKSEKMIQDALENLMRNRTTIVIAHRLSTVQKMDRIVVLSEGKIVEEGTHKALKTRKNGIYAALWAHQSGGFLET